MKRVIIIGLFLVSLAGAWAQGGKLEFSQALIIDDSQVTVPAGKVWKISSVYGLADVCVNAGTLLGVSTPNSSYPYTIMWLSGFQVNGVNVYSEVNHRHGLWCSASNCTSCGDWTSSGGTRGQIVSANPNIFPMWLPAGTTLQSLHANIRVNVLEFTIIP